MNTGRFTLLVGLILLVVEATAVERGTRPFSKLPQMEEKVGLTLVEARSRLRIGLLSRFPDLETLNPDRISAAWDRNLYSIRDSLHILSYGDATPEDLALAEGYRFFPDAMVQFGAGIAIGSIVAKQSFATGVPVSKMLSAAHWREFYDVPTCYNGAFYDGAGGCFIGVMSDDKPDGWMDLLRAWATDILASNALPPDPAIPVERRVQLVPDLEPRARGINKILTTLRLYGGPTERDFAQKTYLILKKKYQGLEAVKAFEVNDKLFMTEPSDSNSLDEIHKGTPPGEANTVVQAPVNAQQTGNISNERTQPLDNSSATYWVVGALAASGAAAVFFGIAKRRR